MKSHSHRAVQRCNVTPALSPTFCIFINSPVFSTLEPRYCPYVDRLRESYTIRFDRSRRSRSLEPVSRKVGAIFFFFIPRGVISEEQSDALRFTACNGMSVGRARARAGPIRRGTHTCVQRERWFHGFHRVAVLPLIIYRVSVKSANRRHRTIRHT